MTQEQLMSDILDSMPYELVFVDCEHIIQYMNRVAKEKFGDIVGKSLLDCHNQESKERILEVYQKMVASGTEILERAGQHLRAYVTPVHDKEGTLVGYYERFERNEKL